MIRGNLSKMISQLTGPVEYSLPIGIERLGMNQFLGKELGLNFSGTINCIACGRKTSKSFSQGYCFPCMQSLAQCDSCIIKPELCHFAQGTCREPDWGLTHCMRPHYVYLANSSGVKVGITRETQLPTRWIDQGAKQGLPVFKVATRYQSGVLEVLFKQHVADKTDWRALLKGDPEPMDLKTKRDELFDLCKTRIREARERFGEGAIMPLEAAELVNIDYPVLDYPTKITSLNLDKTPQIRGTLLGIKGQYLIFDVGVINVRKYTGYNVEVTE